MAANNPRSIYLMKTVALFLTVLVSALAAAASTPELRGIYVEDDKALFVLFNADTNASSRWLALGQDFEGYVLKEFKSDADTVLLAKDGAEFAVKLHAAKVKYAATSLSGTIEVGTGHEALRVQRATLVFDEENTFPLTDGLSLTIKPSQLRDGTILYKSRFEQIGADGKKEVTAAPGVVARPGMAFSMSIGELGFSFKP